MVTAAEQGALDAAEALAALCAEVIGPDLLSVVLHGSLAAGGFRPGRSDLDLIAVVDGMLTDGQAMALEDGVRAADPGSAAGIDLHVVAAAVARTPTPEPVLELHVGRYSDDVEVTRRVADADLLAELSMARAGGRALRGVAASEVIGEVPTAWVAARGRHWLTTWQGLTADTKNAAFMVLTACRMWRFAVEHVHSSKAAAGAWALERDPGLDVVRQALRQYADEPDILIDPDAIAGLLDRVLTDTAR